MNMLNSIVIEGDVSKEIRITADAMGRVTGELEIATSRTYKTRTGDLATETDLFPVVCFGNMVEFMQKHGHEGRGIRAVGRIKLNKWHDETGKLCSRMVIIAEHIELKSKKKEQQGEAEKTA